MKNLMVLLASLLILASAFGVFIPNKTSGCYVSVINYAQEDSAGHPVVIGEVYVPDCSCSKTIYKVTDGLHDILHFQMDLDIGVNYAAE